MRSGRCSRFGCSAAAQRRPFPLLRSSGGGVSDGGCSPPFGGLDMAVLPPASLRSLGYPQCAAGKNKGKRKVKGGSMPAKPLSMRVSRGWGVSYKGITKGFTKKRARARRSVDKPRRAGVPYLVPLSACGRGGRAGDPRRAPWRRQGCTRVGWPAALSLRARRGPGWGAQAVPRGQRPGGCDGCRVYQVGFAPLPTLRSGPPGAPGGPQGAFAGSVEGWGRVMAENAL